MRNKIILFACLFSFVACTKNNNYEHNLLKDIDGNVYKTIEIGGQIWMAENLKTTTYNDGEVIISSPWHSNTEGRYKWASTTDLNNAVSIDIPSDYYGAIYNFAAINSGKLAPKGWRIATLTDWEQLISHIKSKGYENREGYSLKTNSGWFNNGHGDNAFGFSALPAGYVDTFGTPKVDGIIANWATRNQVNQFTFETISLLHDSEEILIGSSSIAFGTSVRCIKE